MAGDLLPLAGAPALGGCDHRRVLTEMDEGREPFEPEALGEAAIGVDEDERLADGVAKDAPCDLRCARDAVRRAAVGVPEGGEDAAGHRDPGGSLRSVGQYHQTQVKHRRPVVDRAGDPLEARELDRRIGVLGHGPNVARS